MSFQGKNAVTDQQLEDAAEIVAALRRIPRERRLDAIVIACKMLIEHPDRIDPATPVAGTRFQWLATGNYAVITRVTDSEIFYRYLPDGVMTYPCARGTFARDCRLAQADEGPR